MDNSIKDDFRKAVLRVEIQHTIKIKNREIIVPTMAELKKAICNNIQKEICLLSDYYMFYTIELAINIREYMTIVIALMEGDRA